MQEFETELEMFSANTIGSLVMGDFNVHHARWLKLSNGNTPEGDALLHICQRHLLKERVGKPTRGEYLLDLVLSNLDCVRTAVLPKVADHSMLLVTLEIPHPSARFITRQVWDFKKADWDGLKTSIRNIEWHALLNGGADEAARTMTETLLSNARRFIPQRQLREEKSSHPWINDRCREAISVKNQADGSDKFKAACESCTVILQQEYAKYLQSLQDRLKGLPKMSKQWWDVNRQLMHNAPARETIPPLKVDGDWVYEATQKADAFATAFSAKFHLPPASGEPAIHARNVSLSDFVLVRQRWCRRWLRKIDDSKATGPDSLPGRILRECADEIALPLCILLRAMLVQGIWPSVWQRHWVAPLHKKKSKAEPNNYRGIHLTPVLSKAAERVLGDVLVAYFEGSGAYGETQFAFRKQHSVNDVVALFVAECLLAWHSGKKLGLYLSDISGAFDKVSTDILMRKLRAVGVGNRWATFLQSYLSAREAVVIVEGSFSAPFVIKNMIFQGTVLGPPLWNVSFQDVARFIENIGFREVRFADDLSVLKKFDVHMNTDVVMGELHGAQQEVHAWGASQQMTFDASKE